MAHSLRLIVQVLVEGPDSSKWLSPAEAWRLIDADPRWDIIDPYDRRYRAVAHQAGPKPIRYIQVTENYGGQKHDV